MKKGYWFLVLLVMTVMMSGCLENRRDPSVAKEQGVNPDKQVRKIVSGPSINRTSVSADTVAVLDNETGNIREIIITAAMRDQLISLIERSIDLSESAVMDTIQGMEDFGEAEEKLLAEMDKIARECGFENFREANQMIDKIQDDPDIKGLMDQLSEIESKDM